MGEINACAGCGAPGFGPGVQSGEGRALHWQRRGAWVCIECSKKIAPDVLLYSIEPNHLESLRSWAKRLYTENRMNGDEMRDGAHAIMAVVRYAESLEALRGPGVPYVHMTQREEAACQHERSRVIACAAGVANWCIDCGALRPPGDEPWLLPKTKEAETWPR